MALTVQGSYFNIESFFRSVEKLSRAMLVKSWTIAPGATSTGSSSGAGQGSGGQASVTPNALTGTLQAVVFESPAVAATVPSATTVAPAQ